MYIISRPKRCALWTFEWQVVHFLLNLWRSREPSIVLRESGYVTELGSEMLNQTTVNDCEEKGEREVGGGRGRGVAR